MRPSPALELSRLSLLESASVNGQISGNSVILQLIASNGLNVGRIGAPAGLSNPSPAPVAVISSASGAVLQGANGYGVTTGACPGGNVPGDVGDVCLGLGNSTSCTQPILLSPASLSFPAQQVGSAPTTQTITLTNNNLSGTPLTGLSLSLSLFNPQPGVTSPLGPATLMAFRVSPSKTIAQLPLDPRSPSPPAELLHYDRLFATAKLSLAALNGTRRRAAIRMSISLDCDVNGEQSD